MTGLYIILFFSMLASIVICAIRIIICRTAENIKCDKGTEYRQRKHNKIYKNMIISVILFILCAMCANAGM